MSFTEAQIEAAALAIINKARADDEDVVLAPLSSLSEVYWSYADWARETARAALEAAERAAWRDISTAPKDGTPILIRFRHANYEFAGDQRHKWEEVCVARWIDHNGGGWTWNGICGRPVDWCPLPAPPEGTPA